VGAGFTQGQVGGEIAHTVNQSEMPAHTHFMQGSSNAADKAIATGNLPASATSNVYGDANSLVAMLPNLISNVGGSQPHTNMQPYLVLNFCVALQGIFPSQN
jgi:microcystin-dependent protein